MKYKSFRNVLVMHKCAECGKEFCLLSTCNYAWKYEKKLLCSYTCMRKYEREHIKNKINTVK